MSWYRTGTVSVTSGGETVTGAGTDFAANCRVGDGFLGADGRWYEVTNVASGAVLSIAPAYLGPTVSAGTYALVPLQGYVKASADALRGFVNGYGQQLQAFYYSSSVAWPEGVVVYQAGHLYQSKQAVPIGKVPPDAAYWLDIGAAVQSMGPLASWQPNSPVDLGTGGVRIGNVSVTPRDTRLTLQSSVGGGTAVVLEPPVGQTFSAVQLGGAPGYTGLFFAQDDYAAIRTTGAVLLSSNSGSYSVCLNTNGSFTPQGGGQPLGHAGLPWSTAYLGSSPIITSDARLKTPVKQLTAAEIACAIDLAAEIGGYQWLASIAEKGAEHARIHIGMTVQRAVEIMEAHGLEPRRYSFICHDEWEDKPAPVALDLDGGLIEAPAEASVAPALKESWSFRYIDLLSFITAGLAAQLRDLSARVAALES